MKNLTVAKRYAQALLSLGLADGNFAAYGEQLAALTEAFQGAGEEAKALASPIYPQQFQRKALNAIAAKAELSPLVTNFLNLLLDKGRLGELEAISEAYSALADAERGIVRAKITSAAPLSEEQTQAIAASLNKFTGKNVELTVEQDAAIIGGLKAQLGDLTIDGSVRTQLAKLAERLDNL